MVLSKIDLLPSDFVNFNRKPSIEETHAKQYHFDHCSRSFGPPLLGWYWMAPLQNGRTQKT